MTISPQKPDLVQLLSSDIGCHIIAKTDKKALASLQGTHPVLRQIVADKLPDVMLAENAAQRAPSSAVMHTAASMLATPSAHLSPRRKARVEAAYTKTIQGQQARAAEQAAAEVTDAQKLAGSIMRFAQTYTQQQRIPTVTVVQDFERTANAWLANVEPTQRATLAAQLQAVLQPYAAHVAQASAALLQAPRKKRRRD